MKESSLTVWGGVKGECHSALGDNYYCFGLAEEAAITPHQPGCPVPRCSALPPPRLRGTRGVAGASSAPRKPRWRHEVPRAFSSTHCISLHIMPVGQHWLTASLHKRGSGQGCLEMARQTCPQRSALQSQAWTWKQTWGRWPPIKDRAAPPSPSRREMSESGM